MEYKFGGQIESPILHRNHYDILRNMENKEILFDIFEYCYEGIIPDNYNPLELSIFNTIIISIETAWNHKVNGSKGGSKGGMKGGNGNNERGVSSNKNMNNNMNILNTNKIGTGGSNETTPRPITEDEEWKNKFNKQKKLNGK